jgi:hypothetical protein
VARDNVVVVVCIVLPVNVDYVVFASPLAIGTQYLSVVGVCSLAIRAIQQKFRAVFVARIVDFAVVSHRSKCIKVWPKLHACMLGIADGHNMEGVRAKIADFPAGASEVGKTGIILPGLAIPSAASRVAEKCFRNLRCIVVNAIKEGCIQALHLVPYDGAAPVFVGIAGDEHAAWIASEKGLDWLVPHARIERVFVVIVLVICLLKRDELEAQFTLLLTGAELCREIAKNVIWDAGGEAGMKHQAKPFRGLDALAAIAAPRAVFVESLLPASGAICDLPLRFAKSKVVTNWGGV